MYIITIIIVGIFLILSIPIILLIDTKYKETCNFQCTNMSFIFDAFENQLNSYRVFGRLHVKCPKVRKIFCC